MKIKGWLSFLLLLIIGILSFVSPVYVIPIILGAIFLIILIINPYIGVSGYLLCFVLPRGIFIGQVILLIASILWLIRFLSGLNKERTLTKSPLNWLFWGILLFALIPIFFVSEVFDIYLKYPKDFLLFPGYFFSVIVISNMIDSQKKINFLVWSLVIFGFLQGIISVIEIYFPFLPFAPLYFSPALTETVNSANLGIITDDVFGAGKSRSVGYIGDGPTVGFYMFSALFLGLALVANETSRLKKVFLVLSFLVITFGIIASLSRIIWGALFIASIYYLKRQGNLVILGISSIIITLLIFANMDNLKFRISQTIEKMSEMTESQGIQQEIAELKRFVENPLIGTGLGNANEFEGIKSYLDELSLFLSPLDSTDTLNYDNVFLIRSFFPSIAVQLGIGGLLCVLLALYCTWRGLSQVERYSNTIKDSKLLNLAIGVKATFLGHLICCVITIDPANKMFWFVVGLAWALIGFAKKQNLKYQNDE